jgi:hypothetical protein
VTIEENRLRASNEGSMQNPLESYRRTQRELRRHFDEFTRANCAECPTPCCVRPARILPTDILLAEASGWRARVAPPEGAAPAPTDMVAAIAGRVADALGNPPQDGEEAPTPCEYLGAGGCTFPTDLRPFGCTTYICRYMHERLDRQALTRIKRLVRELEQKHTVVMRSVRPVRWRDDGASE